MKHLFAREKRKPYSFLLGLLFAFSIASAQDYEQQKKEKLGKLDLSGLGTTLFLNIGVTNQNEVNYFKALSKNKTSKPEPVTSEEWQNLYERLIDTDLRPEKEKIPALSRLVETDLARLTKSNIVPIGIMNMESIYLSGEQLASNELKKKAGHKSNFSSYEKIRIVSASVLQEDLYQGDISFRVSSKLNISNQPDQIQNIEIDFSDGRGYKSYLVSEQLISYRFQSTGEHLIHIRLKTGGTLYIFETKVNVRQLERIKPYKEFQIMANGISQDSSNPDRSARTTLVGGNIRIILGCDQILNKAIIIAEGFDIGQNANLDNLEASFRTPLGRYLAEGYDLVLLDYTDGRAAIENNAQVLKALIQQVNTMKTGTTQSIVIGVSMSGLVARWALREMERDGQAHNVRLNLCFDTPHQGANVPVGLTQLLREANPTFITQVILKFFAKGWRDYYQAFSTPAGRQLLLHWGGHLTGGVGNKHPDFDSFRTQLQALGNGGYPQNCRNIAVISGSMNAGDRRLFTNYTYGSRILIAQAPLILQNVNADVHTNQLNQNSNVLRFASWGLFSRAVGISRTYNSPFNDDFLPGGRSSFAVPSKLIGKNKTYFEFCFVPTFSSMDYQGARTTQAQRELLNVTGINAATTNRQTPFAAVYGNNANAVHVNADVVNWENMGFAEGLLTGIAACPALPTPPIPTITTFNTCYPFDQKRTTEDNTANITVSLSTSSGGAYVHNWRVTPSNQYFTTTGDQITFQAEKPDHYEVTCVRTYPNRRDISSTFTTTIWVYGCSTTTRTDSPLADVEESDIWEGDFLMTNDPDSVAVFAHYSSGSKVLYASLADGTFVSRSELQADGMFVEFAELFAVADPRGPLPVHLTEFNATANYILPSHT